MHGPMAARMPGGVTAKFAAHGGDGFGRDAHGRAAPAGMDGAECTGHGIEQQNRCAVRAEAAERHARLIGDEAVADDGLLAGKTRAAVGSADAENGVRVLLLREDGLLRREADGGAEDAVILTHVFRHVAPVRARG